MGALEGKHSVLSQKGRKGQSTDRAWTEHGQSSYGRVSPGRLSLLFLWQEVCLSWDTCVVACLGEGTYSGHGGSPQ